MGEVYYAEDTKLQRPVALKRVASKLRSSPEARRHILKEAQRASALSSEHIASVYDVVEDGDEIFLVIEYVAGTTLRQELLSKSRIDVDAFLAVAVQCAEALAEAQRNAILHRDIKPENIMLTPAGHVKILDFGLARRLPVADSTAMTATMESQGAVCAGTPGYMAPEVLLEQEVDGRADIFSLGVVFYEMLTGQHPFQTKKIIVTADHILHDRPRPVTELAREVPEELERIVLKMLAKDPKQRYATAADLLLELRARHSDLIRSPGWASKLRFRYWVRNSSRSRRVAALLFAATLFLLLLGLSHHWNSLLQEPQLPEKKYIAVLPFTSGDADPNLGALSQGLTEALTAKLTQVGDRYPVQVVPPSEIRMMSIASSDQAHAELGVNLVLEGSLRQSGSKVRVTYNLVDANVRRVLRADTITTEAGDSFALEDGVVDSALRALELEIGTKEHEALIAHGTSQPVAYDFYLRARGYLQEYQNLENVNSAIEVFGRALDRDPNFSLAYAGLGESYWQKYELTHDREWVAKALEACQRASAGGYGHTCLGTVYNGTGKYEQARTEFERALQQDSTSDDGYRGLAFAYERMGKFAEAEQTYRRAIQIRPDYWGGYNVLGAFLHRQARYEEAAKIFAQVIALAPDNVRGYSNLGAMLLLQGRYSDAVPVLQRAVAIRPGFELYSNLATTLFYLHRFPDAAEAYEQAARLDLRNHVVQGNLGDAYFWIPVRRTDSINAYRRAIVLIVEELQVNPRDAATLGHIAKYHAMLGERDLALEYLQRGLAITPDDPELLFEAAVVHQQLGEPERALQWLAKSLKRGFSATTASDDPVFGTLRSDRRFERLVRDK